MSQPPSDAAKAWEWYRTSRSYRHAHTAVGTAPELALEAAFLRGFDAGREKRAECEESRNPHATPTDSNGDDPR